MQAGEKDKTLFKNMVFYIEIYHEGKPHDEYFKNKVLEHGGKLSLNFSKNVTHLVWSQGRSKLILKGVELNIKIVSPLWLEECLKEMTIADESKFIPAYLDEKQAKANQKNMK